MNADYTTLGRSFTVSALTELRDRRAAGGAKPYLWAMREKADGKPYFDELCVAADPAYLEDYYSDDESVEVIPLYLHPSPDTSKNEQGE